MNKCGVCEKILGSEELSVCYGCYRFYRQHGSIQDYSMFMLVFELENTLESKNKYIEFVENLNKFVNVFFEEEERISERINHRETDEDKKLLDEERERKIKSWNEILDNMGSQEKGLYSLLRSFRNKIAKERDLPSFCIFSNKSLYRLAHKMPRTREELSTINGFKTGLNAEKYGDDILKIIRKNLVDKDGESNKRSLDSIREKYPKAYVIWTKEEEIKLLDLFKDGKSYSEIAGLLGRKKGGVTSRLKKLGVIGEGE